MIGKAILVTGSRHWTNEAVVYEALTKAVFLKPEYCLVIHGCCPTGVDNFVGQWFVHNPDCDVVELPMPAQWGWDKRAAGPIRNRSMVNVLEALRSCGYECSVLAFPKGESPGTRGCMALAKAKRFQVTSRGDPA